VPAIVCGEKITNYLNGGETHVYSLLIEIENSASTSTSAMVIEISVCDSVFDTVIGLYDSAGDILFSNDDSDVCSPESIQSWLITDYCLEPGQYYIALVGYDGTQEGQYSINLTCTECGKYIF